MRSYICGLFIGTLLALTLALSACSKSDNAPTQPGATWTISGKTYLAGSTDPVAGVTVKCAAISATSGADGSYQLRGVPEGSQTVTVEMANYESYTRSIEVKSNVTLHVYLRIKSSSLWGNVSNAIRGPIQGAEVAMDGFVDHTDISGRYEFTNVPQGIYTLKIAHPNYSPFDTVLSLSVSPRQFDAFLMRDSVIQGIITQNKYVDAEYPDYVYPPGSADLLYLRANSYDGFGQYHGNIERNIYINFVLPSLLTDYRVSLVEASLQLCTDAPYPAFPFQVFSLKSSWGGNLTYRTQPAVGPLLTSGSIGGSSSAKYCTVLDTDVWNQLIEQYRALVPFYGIVIKGGVFEPRGFYSTRSPQNPPKITLKVRY